jgi:small multidrug resistance pump
MWWWLAAAIASEVTATLSLKASTGFTRLGPSLVVVVGYVGAFYALSRAMVLGMAVGTAYAVWAGVGVAAVATLGVLIYGERLSWAQVLGIALVIGGVLAIQLGAPAPER